MKVTLDIDALLADGEISQDEYQRISELSSRSTASLGFNLLIAFGAVAVAISMLVIVPTAGMAMAMGSIALLGGLALRLGMAESFGLLGNIFLLIGSLLGGGGLIGEMEANLASFLIVSAVLGAVSLVARSSLLMVMATLLLSAALGARTGYSHAAYFLIIQEPLLTIALFSILGIAAYQVSFRVPTELETTVLASARTSVFLVNFGFWVGSLWGDRVLEVPVVSFTIGWTVALVATAAWAWHVNRRWVVNVVAVFAGIHLYTQWFEYFGANAGTLLLGGVMALAFAFVLRAVNQVLVSKKADV